MTVATNVFTFLCHHNKEIVIGPNPRIHISCRWYVTRLFFNANTFLRRDSSNTLDLWLINLSRASISSLMINKSWPKFWGHEEVLLGNLLWNISQELTLTCELLYGKKKEFPFFDSLLIIFLSISSVLNLSQKVLSAISRNSLTKLRILFSSGSFESL